MPKRAQAAESTGFIKKAKTAPSTASARPKRAAAAAASERISAVLAAEASGASITATSTSGSAGSPDASILRFCDGSESQSVLSGALKQVPPELLDIQVPGQLRTPELYTASVPIKRHPQTRALYFTDHPEFSPNLTPSEILQAGAFGGYYFRTIASTVMGKVLVDMWKEFPTEWCSFELAFFEKAEPCITYPSLWLFLRLPLIRFTGLVPSRHLTAPRKNPDVNRYKVDCGQDLRAWEQQSWIVQQDPCGWFQWYCRFYLGRRTEDDARQISRWVGIAGSKSGRWRNNLIHKCVNAHAAFDDESISPVVRQTLHHWAYELTEPDHAAYAKRVAAGAKTSFIRT